jgi:hypothetical protein
MNNTCSCEKKRFSGRPGEHFVLTERAERAKRRSPKSCLSAGGKDFCVVCARRREARKARERECICGGICLNPPASTAHNAMLKVYTRTQAAPVIRLMQLRGGRLIIHGLHTRKKGMLKQSEAASSSVYVICLCQRQPNMNKKKCCKIYEAAAAAEIISTATHTRRRDRLAPKKVSSHR